MDAVKFLKKYHKLCDPRSCDDCPLLKRVDGFKTCLAGERNGYEERVVEIVEKWSKEQENKMTKQEAIYQIKNLAVLSSEKDMASITEALEMAIEALQQEPKRGKWIPVTERLPEIDKRVIVTGTMWGLWEVDIDRWNGERWVKYGGYVSAWQPIPEPYEESDGE